MRGMEAEIRFKSYEAAYRGGLSTRVSTPWSKSISYARGTLADRRSMMAMRDRGRRVYRENPIGRSILHTELTNVVSDGFTLQAKTDSDEFNSEADETWEAWLDTADLRGMLSGGDFQRQAYRSARRDGDGGIVLVDRGGTSRLQYIPGDLIYTPDGRQGDRYIADGVEVDDSSRPIAFHTLDTDEWGKRTFTRIAARDFIFLTPEIDDDLAVRAPTCYSTIFEYLDQADGYIDSVATAARMACIFGLIFKDDNSAKAMQGLPSLNNSQGVPQRAVTLENGSIKYVGRDSDVVQVQAQQPMNQTPDFIRALLRLIGLPFDMPLELIAHDMSQVNFASARIGLLGYYRACRARQKWFIKRCLDRIYQWWISREYKRQQIGLAGAFVSPFPEKYWKHRFLPRAWDYTDPVSEAQSDLLQIDMGTKSPQMVAAERGRDYDETQIELAASKAMRRLLGLSTDTRSMLTRDAIVVRTDQPGDQTGQTATPPTANEKQDSTDEPTDENAATDGN